jgi:hypothetical protein
LSSFSRTVESAITAAIPVLQIVFMFSGFFLSLTNIPSIFRGIQYLSPLYYGYSTLDQLQWDSNGRSQSSICRSRGDKNQSLVVGNLTTAVPSYSWCYRIANDQRRLVQHPITFNVFMLVLLNVVFHTFAFTIIWYRAYRSRLVNHPSMRLRQPRAQVL